MLKRRLCCPTMAMASKEVDLENYDNTSTANMLLTPRKMKSGSRCRNCITLVFSSIGIIFLLLGYIICGAFVFSNIEGKYSTHKGMLKLDFKKLFLRILKTTSSIYTWTSYALWRFFGEKPWEFKLVNKLWNKYSFG